MFRLVVDAPSLSSHRSHFSVIAAFYKRPSSAEVGKRHSSRKFGIVFTWNEHGARLVKAAEERRRRTLLPCPAKMKQKRRPRKEVEALGVTVARKSLENT
jgi:hypothetical protein